MHIFGDLKPTRSRSDDRWKFNVTNTDDANYYYVNSKFVKDICLVSASPLPGVRPLSARDRSSQAVTSRYSFYLHPNGPKYKKKEKIKTT
jgi:hypothetical protein